MLREILILQTVCGGPNIMKLYDVIHETVNGHPALVVEYANSLGADVDTVYESLTPNDVRYYMKELLIAMAYTHKMDVIHRDLKPQNVLIDLKTRKVLLIDFGLGIFYEKGKHILHMDSTDKVASSWFAFWVLHQVRIIRLLAPRSTKRLNCS